MRAFCVPEPTAERWELDASRRVEAVTLLMRKC